MSSTNVIDARGELRTHEQIIEDFLRELEVLSKESMQDSRESWNTKCKISDGASKFSSNTSYSLLPSPKLWQRVLQYPCFPQDLSSNERFQRSLSNLHKLRRLQRYQQFVRLSSYSSLNSFPQTSLSTTFGVNTVPSQLFCDACHGTIGEATPSHIAPFDGSSINTNSKSLPVELEYLTVLAGSLDISPCCDVSRHTRAPSFKSSEPQTSNAFIKRETPNSSLHLLCTSCLLEAMRFVSAQLRNTYETFQNECREAAASLARALPLSGDIQGLALRGKRLLQRYRPPRDPSTASPFGLGNLTEDLDSGVNLPERVFLHNDIILTILTDEDCKDLSLQSTSELKPQGNPSESTDFPESLFIPALQCSPLTPVSAAAKLIQDRITANTWAAQRTSVYTPLECVINVMGTWIWCVALWPAESARPVSLADITAQNREGKLLRRLMEEAYLSFGRSVAGSAAQRLHDAATTQRQAAADGQTLRKARQRVQRRLQQQQLERSSDVHTIALEPCPSSSLRASAQSLASPSQEFSQEPSQADATLSGDHIATDPFSGELPALPLSTISSGSRTELHSASSHAEDGISPIASQSVVGTAYESAPGEAGAEEAVAERYVALFDAMRAGVALDGGMGLSSQDRGSRTCSGEDVDIKVDGQQSLRGLLPVYVAGLQAALEKLQLVKATDGRVYLTSASDALHDDPTDQLASLSRGQSSLSSSQSSLSRGQLSLSSVDAPTHENGQLEGDLSLEDGRTGGNTDDHAEADERLVHGGTGNEDTMGVASSKYGRVIVLSGDGVDASGEGDKRKNNARNIVFTYFPKYVHAPRKILPELLLRFSKTIPDEVLTDSIPTSPHPLLTQMSDMVISHIIPAFVMKLDNLSYICDDVSDLLNNMRYHGISSHNLGIIARKTRSLSVFRMCVTEMVAQAAVTLWTNSIASLHQRAAAVLGLSSTIDDRVLDSLRGSASAPNDAAKQRSREEIVAHPVDLRGRTDSQKPSEDSLSDAAAALAALGETHFSLDNAVFAPPPSATIIPKRSTTHFLSTLRNAAVADDADVCLAMWRLNKEVTADFLSQLLSVSSPANAYTASKSLWNGSLRDEVFRQFQFDIEKESCLWPLPQPDASLISNPLQNLPSTTRPCLFWQRRDALVRFSELSGVVVSSNVEFSLPDTRTWDASPDEQNKRVRSAMTDPMPGERKARNVSGLINITADDILAITPVIRESDTRVTLDCTRVDTTRDLWTTHSSRLGVNSPYSPLNRSSETPGAMREKGEDPLVELLTHISPHFDVLPQYFLRLNQSISSKTASLSFCNHYKINMLNGQHDLTDLRLLAYQPVSQNFIDRAIVMWNYHLLQRQQSQSVSSPTSAVGLMCAHLPSISAMYSMLAFFLDQDHALKPESSTKPSHYTTNMPSYVRRDALHTEESLLSDDRPFILTQSSTLGFLNPEFSENTVSMTIYQPYPCTKYRNTPIQRPSHQYSLPNPDIPFSQVTKLSRFWSKLLAVRVPPPASSSTLSTHRLYHHFSAIIDKILHQTAQLKSLARDAVAANEQVRALSSRARLQQRSQRTVASSYQGENQEKDPEREKMAAQFKNGTLQLDAVLAKTSFGVSDGKALLAIASKVFEFYRVSGFAIPWESGTLLRDNVRNTMHTAVNSRFQSTVAEFEINGSIPRTLACLPQPDTEDYTDFAAFAGIIEETRLQARELSTMLLAATSMDKLMPPRFKEDTVFSIRNMVSGIFPVVIPPSLCLSATQDASDWSKHLSNIIRMPLHPSLDASNDGVSLSSSGDGSSDPAELSIDTPSSKQAFTTCFEYCSAILMLCSSMIHEYIRHNLPIHSASPSGNRKTRISGISEAVADSRAEKGDSSVPSTQFTLYEYMLEYVKHDISTIARLHADSSSVFTKFVQKAASKNDIVSEKLVKNLPEEFSQILSLAAALEYAQNPTETNDGTVSTVASNVLKSDPSDDELTCAQTLNLHRSMQNHIIFTAYIYFRLNEAITITAMMRDASCHLDSRLRATALLSTATELLRMCAQVQVRSRYLPVKVLQGQTSSRSGVGISASSEIPGGDSEALAKLNRAFTNHVLHMNAVDLSRILVDLANLRLPMRIHLTSQVSLTEINPFDPREVLRAMQREYNHPIAADPSTIMMMRSTVSPKTSSIDSEFKDRGSGRYSGKIDGFSEDSRSCSRASDVSSLQDFDTDSGQTIGSLCLAVQQDVRDIIQRLEATPAQSISMDLDSLALLEGDERDSDIYLTQAEEMLHEMGSQSSVASGCPTDPAFYASLLRFDAKQPILYGNTTATVCKAMMGVSAELSYIISCFLYEGNVTETAFRTLSTTLLDKSSLVLLRKQLLGYDFVHSVGVDATSIGNTEINRVNREDAVASDSESKSQRYSLETLLSLLPADSLHPLTLLSSDPFPVKGLTSLLSPQSGIGDGLALDKDSNVSDDNAAQDRIFKESESNCLPEVCKSSFLASKCDASRLAIARQWYTTSVHPHLLRYLLEIRLTWLFTRKYADLSPEEVHEYRRDIRKQLEERALDASKNVYLYYAIVRIPNFQLLVNGLQRCLNYGKSSRKKSEGARL